MHCISSLVDWSFTDRSELTTVFAPASPRARRRPIMSSPERRSPSAVLQAERTTSSRRHRGRGPGMDGTPCSPTSATDAGLARSVSWLRPRGTSFAPPYRNSYTRESRSEAVALVGDYPRRPAGVPSGRAASCRVPALAGAARAVSGRLEADARRWSDRPGDPNPHRSGTSRDLHRQVFRERVRAARLPEAVAKDSAERRREGPAALGAHAPSAPGGARIVRRAGSTTGGNVFADLGFSG